MFVLLENQQENFALTPALKGEGPEKGPSSSGIALCTPAWQYVIDHCGALFFGYIVTYRWIAHQLQVDTMLGRRHK